MSIQYHITSEQRNQADGLMLVALLDAMVFIADRLKGSNQESYELVSFDDAISTILYYYGYKIKYLAESEQVELYRNDTFCSRHDTRYHAWYDAMTKIIP